MTHPDYIREKALELRRERKLTIDEIAERLALSRSTIYHWVRGIEIPRKPGRSFSEDARKKGNRVMRENYLRKRELAYNSGRHSFHALAEDPTFRDFVSLYIGEGYKRCRNTVSVANSDPLVAELAYRWIRRLSEQHIRCSVQYHEDQDVTMLRGFWGNRLKVDPESIHLLRKSNSNHLTGRTWRCQFGVMSVTVNDTQLRARIEGWIDEMRQSWLDSALSGRGEVWLSHSVWGRKNAGSNPAAPISDTAQVG